MLKEVDRSSYNIHKEQDERKQTSHPISRSYTLRCSDLACNDAKQRVHLLQAPDKRAPDLCTHCQAKFICGSDHCTPIDLPYNMEESTWNHERLFVAIKECWCNSYFVHTCQSWSLSEGNPQIWLKVQRATETCIEEYLCKYCKLQHHFKKITDKNFHSSFQISDTLDLCIKKWEIKWLQQQREKIASIRPWEIQNLTTSPTLTYSRVFWEQLFWEGHQFSASWQPKYHWP